MTAEDVRSRCAHRSLNFRGADLRGLDLRGVDLSGADLRGADLSQADLSGAILDRMTCGVLLRWRLVKYAFRSTVSICAGLLVGLSVAMLMIFIDDEHFRRLGPWFRYVPGLITILSLLHTLASLKKKDGDISKVNTFAYFFAAASVLGIPGASGYGAMLAIGFIFVIASAVFVIIAIAITGNSRRVSLSTIGGFAMLSGSLRMHYDDIELVDILVYFGTYCALIIAIIWVASTIVSRALGGEHRYASVRDLCIWTRALFGTRFDCANLTGATFVRTDLRSTSFFGATLNGWILRGARFVEHARFSPGSLRHIAVLRLLSQGEGQRASFANLDLQGFAIHDADLNEANLSGADLRGADLRGTDLLHAKDMQRARVDPETYKRSQWTPKYLYDIQQRGIQILSVNQLPEDAQDLLLGTREGLTLYFDRTLTALDHLVVQAVITEELGPETDCRVVEFKEIARTTLHAQHGAHTARADVIVEGPRARVRLIASYHEHLLRIADRLYRCIWERQHQQSEQERSQALVRQQQEFDLILSQQQQAYTAALSQLVRVFAAMTAPHLLNMELHEPIPDAVPAGREPDARKPTRRSFAVDLRQGRFRPGRSPSRLAILAAPEDAGPRDALHTHLRSLCNNGWLQILSEGHVLPGDDSRAALREIIESADLALCLISADLLAVMGPDYGRDVTSQARAHLAGALDLAFRRREQGALVVIPVLVRPANVADSPFADLKALPANLQPISGWTDKDAALLEVVAGVRLHLLGAG